MNIEFTIKEIGIGYKVIVLINGKRFESIQSFDTKAEAKEYVNMIYDRGRCMRDNGKVAQLLLRAEELESHISSDEEIEIDLLNGNIWISKYSEAKGTWDGIEKFCKEYEIDLDLLMEQCNKRHWDYVL